MVLNYKSDSNEPGSMDDFSIFTTSVHTDDLAQENMMRLYDSLKRCLRMRQIYMINSRQRFKDNPKNNDNWEIYPPPPSDHEYAGPVGSGFEFTDCFIPGKHTDPEKREMVFDFNEKEGVFQVYKSNDDIDLKEPIWNNTPTRKRFYDDLDALLKVVSHGPTKTYAHRRLKYLEEQWKTYMLENEYQEMIESKMIPHRDFYNVSKVDTHVHHISCMNQKRLLEFMKSKLENHPDEIVHCENGKEVTLKEIFDGLNMNVHSLSIDTLNMHAHTNSFHRFDNFNRNFNPIGNDQLRYIFLKSKNHLGGRYMAELTQEVISDLEASKYQFVEYRFSIYGCSLDEWDNLAKWVVNNKLFSHNLRWLIQVPRIYDYFRCAGYIDSFGTMMKNLFQPLFEVTQDPSSHPELHVFLQRVVGFDSVDDESKSERRIHEEYPSASEWTSKQNPPYSYYLYHMFANMSELNHWRAGRGFNTFVLRPHSGEAGDTEHLSAAFLTSFGISHGIRLRKVPTLQYLYYLAQVGIDMSPLSNNALFLDLDRSPFHQFFQRGLSVALSTDNPLQIHFTKEPLIEEYSAAAQKWKLSSADLCELARNSAVHSGWENSIKKEWLGEKWNGNDETANDKNRTNIPNIRVRFRHKMLAQEIADIWKGASPNTVGSIVRHA